MNKSIMLKFKVQEKLNFSDDDTEESNIAKFEAIASEAGIMTSHRIIFAPGAFRPAITDLKENKDNLLMLFNHNQDEPIGAFPVNFISESSGKLFVQGNINLDVQRGNELFSLIQQGAITDLSVSVEFNPDDISFNEDLDVLQIDNVRTLDEISVVSSGANPKAKITDFSKQNDMNSAILINLLQLKTLTNLRKFKNARY